MRGNAQEAVHKIGQVSQIALVLRGRAEHEKALPNFLYDLAQQRERKM